MQQLLDNPRAVVSYQEAEEFERFEDADGPYIRRSARIDDSYEYTRLAELHRVQHGWRLLH